jgi:effector-binding domain-containing protein
MTTTTTQCRIVTVERQLAAVIEANVGMDELMKSQQTLRPKLAATVRSLDVGPVGHTFTRWRFPVNGRIDLHPGILVSKPFAPIGDVVPSELPAGRAAQYLYVGGYEGIPQAWQTLFDWCNAEKLKLAGLNWEIYDETSGPTPQTSMNALLA